jgi:phosphoribosyl-dephospho-CoA transferase
VKQVITPPQLLKRRVAVQREHALPALRALSLLVDRWQQVDMAWGPGGSVGFELATGEPVTGRASDLDIVLYAERPIAGEEASFICAQASELPAVVDIRVETPYCSFSLQEFARETPAAIMVRTPSEVLLRRDPWRDDSANVGRESAPQQSWLATWA